MQKLKLDEIEIQNPLAAKLRDYYNFRELELLKKLAGINTRSSLEEEMRETLILKGKVAEVRAILKSLSAERDSRDSRDSSRNANFEDSIVPSQEEGGGMFVT